MIHKPKYGFVKEYLFETFFEIFFKEILTPYSDIFPIRILAKTLIGLEKYVLKHFHKITWGKTIKKLFKMI